MPWGSRGSDDAAKAQALLNLLTKMKQDIGIPLSIKETGLQEDQYLSRIEALDGRIPDPLEGFTPPDAADAGSSGFDRRSPGPSASCLEWNNS